VKLLLFLIDIAFTNAWIYYRLANPNKSDKDDARADFFLEIATQLVRQEIDFEAKYKCNTRAAQANRKRKASAVDDGDAVELNEDNEDDDSSMMDLIVPNNVRLSDSERRSTDKFLQLVHCADCIPTPLKNIPFELKKRSRSCQICQYELKHPKWKDVVFCSKHGVQLCLGVSPPRQLATPSLVKEDGSDVTDYSWTTQIEGSCWDKFHQFYLPKGLNNGCNIDLNLDK